MEELRQVGPVSRAARSHVVAPVGLDPQDQNPLHYPDPSAKPAPIPFTARRWPLTSRPAILGCRANL